MEKYIQSRLNLLVSITPTAKEPVFLRLLCEIFFLSLSFFSTCHHFSHATRAIPRANRFSHYFTCRDSKVATTDRDSFERCENTASEVYVARVSRFTVSLCARATSAIDSRFTWRIRDSRRAAASSRCAYRRSARRVLALALRFFYPWTLSLPRESGGRT